MKAAMVYQIVLMTILTVSVAILAGIRLAEYRRWRRIEREQEPD